MTIETVRIYRQFPIPLLISWPNESANRASIERGVLVRMKKSSEQLECGSAREHFNCCLPLWPRLLFFPVAVATKNADGCRAVKRSPNSRTGEYFRKCVAAQSNLAKFLGRAIKGLPPFASYQRVPGSRRFANRSTVQRVAAHVRSLFVRPTKNRRWFSSSTIAKHSKKGWNRRTTTRGRLPLAIVIRHSPLSTATDSHLRRLGCD